MNEHNQTGGRKVISGFKILEKNCQLTFSCSKSTIETVEKIRTPERRQTLNI